NTLFQQLPCRSPSITRAQHSSHTLTPNPPLDLKPVRKPPTIQRIAQLPVHVTNVRPTNATELSNIEKRVPSLQRIKSPLDQAHPSSQHVIPLRKLQRIANAATLVFLPDTCNVRIMIWPPPRQGRETHQHTNHPTPIIRPQHQP